MMMNRRSFLRNAGEGLLLVSSLSLMSSCSGVKRDDLLRRKDEKESIQGLEKDEIEILYLASLAPSAHNTQPWTLKVVEPKHWVIGSDKKRWLPAVDPENREMLLSIGTFIENLVIAAGTYGYSLDLQIIGKNRAETEIAEIRLKKSKTEDFPLEKMKQRRTVRNHFLNEEIKTDDIKYITKHDTRPCLALTESPDLPFPHSFYFPKNSSQGKYLQEGTVEANRTQAFRDAAQEELSNWIRWSNKEAKKYRNGLTPESMDITGVAGLYVRNFFNRQSVLKKSFREQTVDRIAKQVKNCGGWLVITSHDSSIPTLIEYGRRWEGMLLKIREKKIAIHPMTQMLEESPWKNQVAKELGLTGEVQWILRIGYLKSYPDPVSLRMPVTSFIQP
jgi:hypothetical protein